jgi:hypothetical protein
MFILAAASGKMRLTGQHILAVTLVLTMGVWGRAATGQTAPSAGGQQSTQLRGAPGPPASATPEKLPLENLDRTLFYATPEISCVSQSLFDFRDSAVKFKLDTLMNTLRDSRHESWVLAAYPDPKTSRPLIGAGFNLDVRATVHPQLDPLNPHCFIEPSTAQLWEAAGLDASKLQTILDQFDHDLKTWKKKNFRRKIRTHQLSPELTDEEATRLLRISAVQAIYNAKAYCREFDQLTASRQMALSQLVFQMGVNLEEFTQFLSALNDLSYHDSQAGNNVEQEAEHWRAVQSTLVQSDWARRYTGRAVAVIAMFDPNYDEDPKQVEDKVRAMIHPVARHRHKKPQAKTVRTANEGSHVEKTPH